MADGSAPDSARTLARIRDIAPEDWARLTEAGGDPYNPFTDYEFLAAVEDSGSASADTGWGPCHLALEDANGALLAAAPMYLKGHSYGEYVFDHAWADAYQRAGGAYYPKLQICAPFTPATGARFLGIDAERRAQLAAAAAQVAAKMGVSSLHATFLPEEEWRRLGALGYLQRIDQQFHWTNQGYDDFAGFLDGLASRKRKALRKERAAALEDGVEIDWVTGSDLTEAHWDAFWEFYQDTGMRKWGRPYLTRAFFS
ncbi:MAG: peptidogalycan biosysnthesis protein, partial [Pseudomonadota bacterium]